MINIIACIDLNNGLGYKNELLYHIPEDLKRFKQLTSSEDEEKSVVVMGRKTFESIGTALPNRANIVLTRDTNYTAEHGVIVAHNIDEITALTQFYSEVLIIGGEEIYSQFLNLADNIYLTIVHESHKPSDTSYPRSKQDSLGFKLDSHESHYSDKYNAIYSFKKYSR